MVRASEVYPAREGKASGSSSPVQPEQRQPASVRRQIQAVKDGVRIETVASDYSDELRLLGGGRLLSRCVSPVHEDKTPSMTVYTDTQTFKCYGIGCSAQGDVIDLVKLAEGCEMWEAMVHLSIRYGVELPGRPESWYRKQARQRPVREAIDRARFEHLRRRLFRQFFLPSLALIENPDERKAEAAAFWEATDSLARMMLERLAEAAR